MVRCGVGTRSKCPANRLSVHREVFVIPWLSALVKSFHFTRSLATDERGDEGGPCGEGAAQGWTDDPERQVRPHPPCRTSCRKPSCTGYCDASGSRHDDCEARGPTGEAPRIDSHQRAWRGPRDLADQKGEHCNSWCEGCVSISRPGACNGGPTRPWAGSRTRRRCRSRSGRWRGPRRCNPWWSWECTRRHCPRARSCSRRTWPRPWRSRQGARSITHRLGFAVGHIQLQRCVLGCRTSREIRANPSLSPLSSLFPTAGRGPDPKLVQLDDQLGSYMSKKAEE